MRRRREAATAAAIRGKGYTLTRTAASYQKEHLSIGDAIHVLHAFQKKSKSGISTPQPHVNLIGKRLKAVLARHGLSGR